MLFKQQILAGVMALAVLPGVAMAAGDAEAGKARAAACFACHGENGKATIPTYPHLAGQNAGYLVEALKAYRAKKRTGGQAMIMLSQAGPLSDEDIENIAAYFASLAP